MQAGGANDFQPVGSTHSQLLTPELVHAYESTWVALFKLMPQGEITCIRRLPKSFLKFGNNIWLFESTKFKAQLIQTSLNLRDGEAMLLHMKYQVSKRTEAKKVSGAH